MSIAMKRFLKVAFWVLFIAFDVLAIASAVNTNTNGAYTVDIEEFDTVIEWGEDVSLDGITIVDNRVFGMVKTNLTEDMIVSISDTDIAGRKEIVFKYNKKEYTVYFDVKYRVDFSAYGEVLDSQLVTEAGELQLPTPTAKPGYRFSHWDYDFGNGLNSSITVNAVFEEIDQPELSALTATYGDTLSSLTLPSNENGRWEFVAPLDTPVGNAGVQSFGVRFVYYDDDDFYKYDFVDVNVSKKELSFSIGSESFVYDGEPHFPSYSVSEDVMVISAGSTSSVPGTYTYSLEIIDANYFGMYEGSYEITKPTVTVNVSSATIVYPAAVPEFTYTVEGFENVELLGITLNVPSYASQVGIFEIRASYTNENVDYVINNGTLTVLPGDISVAIPEIGTVTYEDKLSDVEFVGGYLGTWEWEDPDMIIDNIEGVLAYAIFTHNDPGYNPVRMAIEITNIKKKTLTISITESVYTYSPDTEYSIAYEITGGRYPELYASLTVNGNESASLAGNYIRTLIISDARYEGMVTAELKIEKRDPVTDFGAVYMLEWNEMLTLESITLPEGYAWATPSYRIASVGVAAYKVIFTPADTANYNTVEGEITVSVAKANVGVNGLLDSYSKVYDGEKLDIARSGITVYYTDGELTVKYYKNGVEVDEIVNAGTYTVVVNVTEGTNYLGVTLEREVTILAKANTQTVETSQTAVYLDSMSVLKLPAELEGSWSWLETELGGAGTKTFTAVYTPDANGNYEPRRVEVTVTVKKMAIDVPTVSDNEYTGSEIDTGLASTDEYTVDGDITAKHPGNYSVTFTLNDPDNYEWKGYASEISVTREYKIRRLLNTWATEPANIKTVYTGNPVYMLAEASHGTVNVVYTINGEVVDAPVNVGVYQVTVTALSENYDDLVAVRTIEITQQTVTAPTVSTTFTYNGQEQSISIDDEGLDVLYTVSFEQKGTNAGDELIVILKLKDAHNYRWDITDSDSVTLSAAIGKISVSFKDATAIDDTSWTFTDTEGNATAASVNDEAAGLGVTAKLLYSYNGGAYVTFEQLAKTDGRLNAGTYNVKTVVDGTVNWDGIETAFVTFTVSRAKPDSIVVDWGNSVKDGDLYYQNLLYLKSLKLTYNGTELAIGSYTFAISESGFQAENTEYTFTVIPSDTVNFETVVKSVPVSLKTVATIGNGGSEAGVTAFGTIEDAVARANENAKNGSGGTEVWVLPDITGNVVIKNSITINSGVKLILPYVYNGKIESNKINSDNTVSSVYHNSYDSEGNIPDDEQNPMMADAVATADLCSTKVIIAANVTVTVNGDFIVAGQLDGGKGNAKFSGQTGGYHARLVLNDGVNIFVGTSGSFRVLGFVEDESSASDPSCIEVLGNLYQPLVIRDFKGGTFTSALYKDMESKGYAPFNQLQYMNIHAKVIIHYGGSFSGYTNIYANNKHNTCLSKYVGTTSEYLVQLVEGARLVAEYNSKTEIMDVHIYGGAIGNSLDQNVAGTDVSSSEFLFALSWFYNITLDADEGKTAVYTMPYRYRLLPGGSLTVEKGATLYVEFLAVYEEFKDTATYGKYPTKYPATSSNSGKAMPAAKLVVNGTLVAGTLGGKVYTTSTNGSAKIIVTKSNVATTYEALTVSGSSFLASVATYATFDWKLELYYNSSLMSGDVLLNIQYTASAEDKAWVLDLTETVEVELGNGYGVYTEYAVYTDANGKQYLGVYDSRDSKVNGKITVVKNAPVTFYLTKNHLLVEGGGTSATVSSGHGILSGTSVYEQEWLASSDKQPIIYYVPSFNLSGDEVDCSVTYYNLSLDNTAENSNAYAVITINKTYNKNKYDVTVSMTLTGIDTEYITVVSGAYESGSYTATGSATATVTLNITLDNANDGADLNVTVTITETEQANSGGGSTGCVTPDTLITLADGTQVRVDSLTGDELLLVWNLETGKLDFAPIMFVDSEAMAECQVIYLYFSDGTVVKVIYEHGFWDYDLNRYVYLDENAYDYIGHTFAKQNGDELAKVQLVDVEIRTEMATAWSPVTVGHLCYFVNGMLSMPGGVGGLFNIFEVDAETMTYDFEALERDIAEYGLFTYEELNAICPLTEDMFYAAGGAYLKISIAKGNLTMEELADMINRYSVYV